MIPISDLRPGNLIKTEYGILSVHSIVFDSVQVKGKDGRILWAKEIEGLLVSFIEISRLLRGYVDADKAFVWNNIKFIHQLQNHYYWNTFKELELGLGWESGVGK